jgi:hypothetical protein
MEENLVDHLSGSSESLPSHHVLVVSNHIFPFDRCAVSLPRSGLPIIPVRERKTTARRERRREDGDLPGRSNIHARSGYRCEEIPSPPQLEHLSLQVVD